MCAEAISVVKRLPPVGHDMCISLLRGQVGILARTSDGRAKLLPELRRGLLERLQKQLRCAKAQA